MTDGGVCTAALEVVVGGAGVADEWPIPLPTITAAPTTITPPTSVTNLTSNLSLPAPSNRQPKT